MTAAPTTLALDLGNSTLAVGVFAGEQLVTHITLPVAENSPQTLAAKVAKLARATDACRPRDATAKTAATSKHQAPDARATDVSPTSDTQKKPVERLRRNPTPDALPTEARTIKGSASLCSVVPALTEPLCDALEIALGARPRLLTPRAKHGLKINYRRPGQLGADRLAAALGARKLYPRQNLVVVDCGTATTLTFITRDGALLGGAILPGLGLWADALARATAQLPKITLPRNATTHDARADRTTRTRADAQWPSPVATDTASAIRAGLLYGHVGAIRELVRRGSRDTFGPRAAAQPVVIGTGGQALLLAAESGFTVSEPALTLHGLQAFAATH